MSSKSALLSWQPESTFEGKDATDQRCALPPAVDLRPTTHRWFGSSLRTFVHFVHLMIALGRMVLSMSWYTRFRIESSGLALPQFVFENASYFAPQTHNLMVPQQAGCRWPDN